MNKTLIIAALIANCGWTPEDKDFLTTMDDARLQRLANNAGLDADGKLKVAANAKTMPAPKADAGANDDDADDKGKKKAPTKNEPAAPAKVVTMEEYVAAAPEGMRGIFEESILSHNQEKERLIGVLTANKACPFTAEQLTAKPLSELRGLVQLAAAAQPAGSPPAPVHDYRGLGSGHVAPAANAAPNAGTPLPLPTLNDLDDKGASKKKN